MNRNNSPLAFSANANLMPQKGVGIPSALLRSPHLSGKAKSLYGLLLTYAVENPTEWPGQKQLCEHMGVTDNTLRVALRELQGAGLVTMRRNGHGRTATYQVREGSAIL